MTLTGILHLKIQDIVKKYRHERSVPDFYVSLFANDAE